MSILTTPQTVAMTTLDGYLLVIDGEDTPAASGETFVSVNPATNEPIAEVALAGAADIDRAVAAARLAFDEGPWPRMRASERGQILLKIAMAIREQKDELAQLESLDVGKPLREAYRDVETVARYFEFYAGAADKIAGSTIPVGDHLLDVVVREPIGVSGQILPFNYPLQNTGRGAAPAMAVGCTVVLKPSPECTLTPLRIAQIALDCGVPKGVLNVVAGKDEAGAALSSHPDINQVTFTGSVATGIKVAQSAAANVVPTVLELGGKSPAVVFNDLDPERTLTGIMASMYSNAGQTCAAATRLLLQRGEAGDAFLADLIDRVRALTVGPGLDNYDVGPLVSAAQRDRVIVLLDAAIADCATVHVGGGRPDDATISEGFFIAPTVLEVGSNRSMIAQTEIFGPVLTVIRFDEYEEAVVLANETPYGLSSSVWTKDIDKALGFAKRIRAGQVNVNTFDVGTGAELPFGGYKTSGWGREKGLESLNSYLEIKNICIGIKAT